MPHRRDGRAPSEQEYDPWPRTYLSCLTYILIGWKRLSSISKASNVPDIPPSVLANHKSKNQTSSKSLPLRWAEAQLALLVHVYTILLSYAQLCVEDNLEVFLLRHISIVDLKEWSRWFADAYSFVCGQTGLLVYVGLVVRTINTVLKEARSGMSKHARSSNHTH